MDPKLNDNSPKIYSPDLIKRSKVKVDEQTTIDRMNYEKKKSSNSECRIGSVEGVAIQNKLKHKVQQQEQQDNPDFEHQMLSSNLDNRCVSELV